MAHILPEGPGGINLVVASTSTVGNERWTLYADDVTISANTFPGAFLTVVLYDWLLQLDDEVQFIYPARWSLFKILYLFVSSYMHLILTAVIY